MIYNDYIFFIEMFCSIGISRLFTFSSYI